MQTKFVKQAIKDLEAKAKAKELTMYKLCQMAGIDMSLYYRWVAGKTSPALKTWGKLHDMIDGHNP